MQSVVDRGLACNEERDPEELAAEREALLMLWESAEDTHPGMSRTETLEAIEHGLLFTEAGLYLRLSEADSIGADEVSRHIRAMMILLKQTLVEIGNEVSR